MHSRSGHCDGFQAPFFPINPFPDLGYEEPTRGLLLLWHLIQHAKLTDTIIVHQSFFDHSWRRKWVQFAINTDCFQSPWSVPVLVQNCTIQGQKTEDSDSKKSLALSQIPSFKTQKTLMGPFRGKAHNYITHFAPSLCHHNKGSYQLFWGIPTRDIRPRFNLDNPLA